MGTTIKTLLAAAGSALILAGCSTTPTQEQILQGIDKYDETRSYATNVTFKTVPTWPKQFDFSKFQKWVYGTYIPDDEYKKLFGSTDSRSGIRFDGKAPEGPDYATPILWAGSQLAKSSAFSLLGSNKIDALLFFLWTAPASENRYKGVNFSGFVKKTDAATAEQAKRKFLEGLVEAYRKTLAENGFENIEVTSEVKGSAKYPIFGQGDMLEITRMSAVKKGDPSTTVKLYVRCHQEAVPAIDKNVLPWISEKNEPAWMIQADYFAGGGLYKNDNLQPVEAYDFFASAARHFPDYTFMMFPNHPYAVENGEEKWAAPFVADNKGRYWYVMPQSKKNPKLPF